MQAAAAASTGDAKAKAKAPATGTHAPGRDAAVVRYVWVGNGPSGLDKRIVPDHLIREMKEKDWDSVVFVNDQFYAVVPEAGAQIGEAAAQRIFENITSQNNAARASPDSADSSAAKASEAPKAKPKPPPVVLSDAVSWIFSCIQRREHLCSHLRILPFSLLDLFFFLPRTTHFFLYTYFRLFCNSVEGHSSATQAAFREGPRVDCTDRLQSARFSKS